MRSAPSIPTPTCWAAHVDVQPTCEEEVLSGDAGRYKVILLWRVQYLRQSVVTALEDYIARGGVVICDATTRVPIKGAIKTSVDLAMGDGKSNPDPNDPRFGGPGITGLSVPGPCGAGAQNPGSIRSALGRLR